MGGHGAVRLHCRALVIVADVRTSPATAAATAFMLAHTDREFASGQLERLHSPVTLYLFLQKLTVGVFTL